MFLPTSSSANTGENNPAATVIAVRGGVKATDPQGNSRVLKVKSKLFQNDQLDTGKRGRVQIMFTDNTIISLGRKTILLLAEYNLKNDNTGTLKTNVSEGVFRVMGGMLTKTSPEKFSTQTPSGNIGIRGSMYTGKITNKETTVIFEGGKGITFKNKTGTVLISSPGNGTKINGFSSPIPKPHQFSASDIKAFRQEFIIRPTKQSSQIDSKEKAFHVPVTFSQHDGARLHAPPATKTEQQQESPATETDVKELSQKQQKEIQAQDIEALTDLVKSKPGKAAEILRGFGTQKNIKIEKAVEAVFRGMRNPSREEFDAVMYQAIEMGITVDDAKEIVKKLKESGGICK